MDENPDSTIEPTQHTPQEPSLTAAALGTAGMGALVVGISLLGLSLVALEVIEPSAKTASETASKPPSPSETAATLGPLLAAALVLGLAHLARKKRRPLNDVVVLAAPTMAGIILCLLPSYSWWNAYQYDGTRRLTPVMVGAGIILIGVGWTLINARRIYLDLHPQPPAGEAAGIQEAGKADDTAHEVANAAATDAVKADPEPDSPDSDNPKPNQSGAGHSTGALSQTAVLLRRRPRSWVLLPVAACAPVVTVALVLALVSALAAAVLPFPDISPTTTGRRADAVDPDSLPAVPTAAPTQVAWTTTLMGVDHDKMSMVAGTRGPILLTGEGLRALDGQDGSILWTYHATNADHEGHRVGDDYRYTLVSSPDRRHVAVVLESVDERFDNVRGFIIMVLDAGTGEVTAEHEYAYDYNNPPGVQLTDSVALVGRDVISLDGGSLLGRISPEEAEYNYTGTAGHSTLVVAGTDADSITLHLVPETDLARRTELKGLCRDQFLSPPVKSELPTIEAGWTALCTSGTEDPDTHATSWTMTAVNIDEIAASGVQGEVDAGNVPSGSQVPLGTGLGLDRAASAAGGTLITRTEKDRRVWEDSYGDTRTEVNPQVHMVLDPATRTAFPADQSASIATAEISFAGLPYGEPVSDYTLTIAPSNGAPPVSAAFTSTQIFSSPDHEYFPDDDYRHVVGAPGASVIALVTSDFLSGPFEITIVGVR
ncbi:hypothetical protein ACSL103130_01040 [Actinomyces slackii]|uniref:Uncharacterized protein n=1 Tax=Actinomyces slackii TaxID=52774 RepID=A0A3S4SSM0_9ACTO|nr:hypothetical protein [Actinomyces slackii]VEG74070.1 Uncharacterised protein [Actinomyces slackii]